MFPVFKIVQIVRIQVTYSAIPQKLNSEVRILSFLKLILESIYKAMKKNLPV